MIFRVPVLLHNILVWHHGALHVLPVPLQQIFLGLQDKDRSKAGRRLLPEVEEPLGDHLGMGSIYSMAILSNSSLTAMLDTAPMDVLPHILDRDMHLHGDFLGIHLRSLETMKTPIVRARMKYLNLIVQGILI